MSGITRRFCKRCLWAKPVGPRHLCVTSPPRRNGVKPPQIIHTGLMTGGAIGPRGVIYETFRSDCGKEMVGKKTESPIAIKARAPRGRKYVKRRNYR